MVKTGVGRGDGSFQHPNPRVVRSLPQRPLRAWTEQRLSLGRLRCLPVPHGVVAAWPICPIRKRIREGAGCCVIVPAQFLGGFVFLTQNLKFSSDLAVCLAPRVDETHRSLCTRRLDCPSHPSPHLQKHQVRSTVRRAGGG